MASTSDHSASRSTSAGSRLNELLARAGEPELDPELAGRFQAYLEVLVRWNARQNLTAIRDVEGILSRHFLESIVCARAIPAGIRTLLDFGSGAGFPGIPIALCRPEIAVTLAESQSKKAAFLHEAMRTVGLHGAVYAERAETLKTSFDCVAMRAVDRMERAVSAAARLVAPQGWLALIATRTELPGLQTAAGPEFTWLRTVRLPLTENGLIELGARAR